MLSDEDDEDEEDPAKADEEKAPRLDSELRAFTPEEIGQLNIDVLNAKIATLEGPFSLLFRFSFFADSCVAYQQNELAR